jgi:hypothetical protein
MHLKKLVVGGVIATAVLYSLEWLCYQHLFNSYFQEHSGLVTNYERTEPLVLYLIIGDFLFGFLLSYLFVKAKINTFLSGFLAGGIFGMVLTASKDSMVFGATKLLSRSGVLGDVLIFAAISAITGAIIAIAAGSNDLDEDPSTN